MSQFSLQAVCVCEHREWSHWRGKCQSCECKSFRFSDAPNALRRELGEGKP